MGMIQELQKAGKERRAEVIALRSGVVTTLKDFAKGGAERRSEVAERRSEVKAMLMDFDKAHSLMSKGLKTGLANTEAERRSEVSAMLGDLAKGDAQRRSEVAAIHEMVWGRAAVKVVVEEAPVGALRNRVFAYLANHPDGTKLTELEEEFGLARIQVAKVTRSLMDDNKVEKREQLYFAI